MPDAAANTPSSWTWIALLLGVLIGAGAATLGWRHRVRRLERALRRERAALQRWRDQGSRWRRRAGPAPFSREGFAASRWFEPTEAPEDGITVPSALHKP